MIIAIALLALLQSAAPAPEKSAAAPAPQAIASSPQPEAKPEPPVEDLLKVKRIYVESFGDDATSKQVHATLIAAISASKRFRITENKEKADAILKGSGTEKSTQEFYAHKEGTAVATGGGGSSGSWVGGSGSFSGDWASHAAAIEDASASTETIDKAKLAVRLVNSDGEVIWSTSQESHNAKYKSATADVAEKVVRQLLRDCEKLEKKAASDSPAK